MNSILKPEIKTYIQKSCPTGITLFRDKSLYVKVSKTVNGKEQSLTKVINMNLDSRMSDVQIKANFESAWIDALNVKRSFTEQINNPNFSFHKKQAVGVGTLGSVYNLIFAKRYGTKSELQQQQVGYFYDDLKEFFGEDKRLSEITEANIDEFKLWVARKIAERPSNRTGTVSNNSVNKRLGVLRSIFQGALKERLLNNDQLINPDVRVKNMGIEDLPRGESQRKPAFKLFEQEQFLKVAELIGGQEWHDLWAWCFDTGMRHFGELDKFTIDNIDFGRKTITFMRPKLKKYSIEMPLTPRCYEIAKRRRTIAMSRDDRRVFPMSKGQRKNNWEKIIRRCNFNAHFTPYTTRHTFITLLAEANVNPKVAMELAGHTRIETTLTYYTKSSDKVLQNAISSLHSARINDDSSIVEEQEFSMPMLGHNSRKALK